MMTIWSTLGSLFFRVKGLGSLHGGGYGLRGEVWIWGLGFSASDLGLYGTGSGFRLWVKDLGFGDM